MPRALQIGNRQSAVGNVTAASNQPAMESGPSALTEAGNMGSVHNSTPDKDSIRFVEGAADG
jgi:hypothetical protein